MSLNNHEQNQFDDRLIAENIEKFGWHVCLIEESKDSAGWAFSIGLFESFEHPEIVVFGLPMQAAHGLLNYIGSEIQEGRKFNSGEIATDLLNNDLRCEFRPIDKKWYKPLLGAAIGYYKKDFPALQLFWPDASNLLPWEDGFNPAMADHQPFLFHDNIKDARTGPYLQFL